MFRFSSASSWVAAALLAACGTGTPDDAAVVATYASQASESASAELHGTVRFLDGCLIVETDLHGKVIPVFAESEVEWNEGNLVYLGQRYPDGQEIDLGGGLGDKPTSGARIPEACPDLKVWIVGLHG